MISREEWSASSNEHNADAADSLDGIFPHRVTDRATTAQ
jgi:hypothetical protein